MKNKGTKSSHGSMKNESVWSKIGKKFGARRSKESKAGANPSWMDKDKMRKISESVKPK